MPSTAALLAEVADGDIGAFAALYDDIAPSMLATALDITGDLASAETATHAALVEIWHTAPRCADAVSDVATWARAIAAAHARSHPL
ncbi:hypothetical protein GIY23_20550 [Allosaccharopolyspora coralli]|uniref:RNA polymerase sigma-70 region 2 domain-containing protein n=1 Tax=Allosaccharopolyspora coralli TaxID=2665642 RepID=A0A5Q3QCH0_9PSEU|nr:hypothetical protein [Allosaccharopolyspora coralli]QGK71590.1 hypothetical protein GIY23_20550 [Allosaccharopolyspora coralli]